MQPAISRDQHNLRWVFQQAFSVKNIAQGLPSFDATTSCEDVQKFLANEPHEVIGIRTSGTVTGFLERSNLGSGCCGQHARQIDDADVVTDALPLAPLVLRLKEVPRLFVESFGQIAGVVTRFDLQKPPGRMWLFGMITLIEMRFDSMIAEHCQNGLWQELLSEGRIQKAQDLLAERQRRGQQVVLLNCLQFADKVRIIATHEPLRLLTRFESKRQVELIGKQLESLRNNLAHAQEIITTDWDTVLALAEQIDSVLDGPQINQSPR